MSAALRAEIDKRLTLNWLIQGASQHVGLTLHHLVRDELVAIDPELPTLYDQFTLLGLLQYWRFGAVVIFGWPPTYWRNARRRASHPFHGHRLLSHYGGELAEAGRQRARKRAREKGLHLALGTFTIQLLRILHRIRQRELGHREALERLAAQATSSVWNIPVDRLRGELSPVTPLPSFAPIQPTRGLREAAFLAGVVGWGGVQRDEDSALFVRARANNGCLLAKELVKGTAELVCLHGLADLDPDVYDEVKRQTDRLGFEPPMIQTGGELWRRLLKSMPLGQSIAPTLMHLARLPPARLESLMETVIEERPDARERLATLAD